MEKYIIKKTLLFVLLFGVTVMGGCTFQSGTGADDEILESIIPIEDTLVYESVPQEPEDGIREVDIEDLDEDEKIEIICEHLNQMDFTVNEPRLDVTEEENRLYLEAYLKVLKNEIPADGETYYADLWKAGREFETLLENKTERKFLYYYDDLDGDGKPEFAIKQGCMYIFDYDMEEAKCSIPYSQQTCYFKKILGAGQIWYHDGLHANLIRDSLYILNENNEWVEVLNLEEGLVDPTFYEIGITTPKVRANVGKENWDIVTAPFFEMTKEGLPQKTLEEVFGDLLEEEYGFFSEKTYEYHSENMSATLSYPQITGSRDTEKEKKINKLIEDDIIKIIELDTPDEYGRILDVGVRTYEIKYANEKVISIAYYGWIGRLAAGSGLPATMFTTTIDIEEEKVLELSDVICDMDGLYEQLKDDRFEHITAWEGETGYYKITTDFYCDEDLREALLSGKMEWYVDGDNLVVADLEYRGGGVGYNEYAGDIEQLDGIIDNDFRKKIKWDE
ncbi:MAG: hypothetical protein K2O32_11160 [Acetatifactor sp.]|nr:hypothetical protein [Acetatifactor sp.]